MKGLTLKYTDRVDISGFINIKEYCIERGLNCFEFDNYSLKDGEVKLNNVEIDNLFVAGWQRLVPPWLINNVNYHTLVTMEVLMELQRKRKISAKLGNNNGF